MAQNPLLYAVAPFELRAVMNKYDQITSQIRDLRNALIGGKKHLRALKLTGNKRLIGKKNSELQ
jgi:hypothetical protein